MGRRLTRREKTKIFTKAIFRLKRPLVEISAEAVRRGDLSDKHLKRIAKRGDHKQVYEALNARTSEDMQLKLAKRFTGMKVGTSKFMETLLVFNLFMGPSVLIVPPMILAKQIGPLSVLAISAYFFLSVCWIGAYGSRCDRQVSEYLEKREKLLSSNIPEAAKQELQDLSNVKRSSCRN
jgi:hypothetical protein